MYNSGIWLHMQGVASAPLWDEETGSIIGMISASDFIHILRRLRNRCAMLPWQCLTSLLSLRCFAWL